MTTKNRLPKGPGYDVVGAHGLSDPASIKEWIKGHIRQLDDNYRKIRLEILRLETNHYPRRLSQSAAPVSGTGAEQINVGESLIWHDSDDDKIYLVYNDITSGVVSVELT